MPVKQSVGKISHQRISQPTNQHQNISIQIGPAYHSHSHQNFATQQESEISVHDQLNVTQADKCVPLAMLYTYDDHNKLLAAKFNQITSRNTSTADMINTTVHSLNKNNNRTIMSHYSSISNDIATRADSSQVNAPSNSVYTKRS